MMLLDQKFDFSGAKIALIYAGHVLTILRDDIPSIPFPNTWDLAGGGREGEETPFECIQREFFEELGIKLSKESIMWVRSYPGVISPEKLSIFMVGQISQEQINQIIFGDEGQGWKMMPLSDWLKDETVMPQLRERLGEYVEGRDNQ